MWVCMFCCEKKTCIKRLQIPQLTELLRISFTLKEESDIMFCCIIYLCQYIKFDKENSLQVFDCDNYELLMEAIKY